MRSCHRSLIVLIGLALVTACSDAPTAVEEPPSVPSTSDASLAPGADGLPIYGLGGLARVTPGRPCAGPMHRQFDFWLGEWNVFNPDEVQVGTNVVTSELDGCVVTESWMGAGGIPGRSINTFDAETGQWHQMWTSANFRQHLRMAGGIDERGRMVLEGRRDAVQQGITLINEFIWTVLGPDRVRQVGVLTVPEDNFEGEFVGIYERGTNVTPAPETPTTGCQPGGPAEQARQLDFWLGEWRVSAANGRELGTAEVSTDLSGCLVEERFRTARGYEAVSFTHFDVWEQGLFRTYIDNRGERLELEGGLQGDAVVLSGPEAGPGRSGSLLLRVTLSPAGPDAVRQLWEVSRDGGERWTPAADLRYERR